MAETSESQSVNENTPDFALGDLDKTCGSITVVKDAVPDDAQTSRSPARATRTTLIPNFDLDDDGTNTGTGGDIKNSKKSMVFCPVSIPCRSQPPRRDGR